MLNRWSQHTNTLTHTHSPQSTGLPGGSELVGRGCGGRRGGCVHAWVHPPPGVMVGVIEQKWPTRPLFHQPVLTYCTVSQCSVQPVSEHSRVERHEERVLRVSIPVCMRASVLVRYLKRHINILIWDSQGKQVLSVCAWLLFCSRRGLKCLY